MPRPASPMPQFTNRRRSGPSLRSKLYQLLRNAVRRNEVLVRLMEGVEPRYTISFDIPALFGREMRHVKIFCFAFWLALCSSMAVNGQSEDSLSSRITEALKIMEPGWKPIATIENLIPLVPSQRRILTAVWASPAAYRRCEHLCLQSRESWRGSGVAGTSSR